MTLPTREEIADIIGETIENAPAGFPTWQAIAEFMRKEKRGWGWAQFALPLADALLARLRPGWVRLEAANLELLRERAAGWREAMRPVDLHLAADTVVQSSLTREEHARSDVRAASEKLTAALADLRACAEALSFYGDPATYFAIAFLADPPCGEFPDDFDETELGQKPGKRARAALARPGVQAGLT